MPNIENIKNISIKDFDYELPDNKIAKYPLKERDTSKLLIYKDNKIQQDSFKNISEYLPGNSLLVYNNTKVIYARLHFKKVTGANIEIFCLEPHHPKEYNLVFQQTKSCTWKCIVGNLKKWKQGILEKEITVDNKKISLKAERLQNTDELLINFSWDKDVSFGSVLEANGEIPIPPYLNRESEENDKETYQTIYSKYKGSVAAPTAGLHFTNNVFEKLKTKNIKTDNVTLHVGAGTFKPVKSEKIGQHEMHFEHFTVNKSLILNLQKYTGKTFPVGTTTVRTIESLYYIAYKIKHNIPDYFTINQWDAYSFQQDLTSGDALNILIDYMQKNNLDHIEAKTQIMITPSYSFKFINGLITNFHQPKSTLLLLISAVVGNNWKAIYKYALENDFRFLSYGDSSLLFLNNK